MEQENVELDAAGGGAHTEGGEFAAMLEASLQGGRSREVGAGERVKGKLVRIGEEESFLDFGGRSEGVLKTAEIRDQAGQLVKNVGDELEAVVSSVEGQVVLTLALRADHADHQAIARAMQDGLPVEGHVKSVNAGGFEVRVAGLRAFCPFSQMDLQPVGDGQSWVGRTLQFKITEFAESGRKFVVSRRSLLGEERARAAAGLRGQLEVGQVRTGTVTRVAAFGAFVDLGGIEGLVHVSELRHERVEDPATVVHPGQEIQVKITRLQGLGEEKERISLSVKALEADPWTGIAQKLREGDVVQGQVARIADFGAFVEVLPGLDGLVHVSQISWQRVSHARDVLKVGQSVTVKILKIDPVAKRLSLSIRETEGQPAQAAVSKGEVFDAVIRNIKPYGVFVDLPNGRSGLLPKAETDMPRNADPGKFFKIGDTVKVAVLEVDAEGKIRLSSKAASDHEERQAAQQFLGKYEAPAQSAPSGAFAEALRKAEERKKSR